MVFSKELKTQFEKSCIIKYINYIIVIAIYQSYFIQIIITTRIGSKNSTNEANSMILASFERRNLYLSNDCQIDNFGTNDGNLQSN